MTWPSLSRYLSASALTILIALPASAQSIIGKDKTGFLGRAVPEMGHPK